MEHTSHTLCITCRRCRCPKHHPPGPCDDPGKSPKGEKVNRGRRFFLMGALFAPVAQRLTDFVGPMGAIGPKSPLSVPGILAGTTGVRGGPTGPTGPWGQSSAIGWTGMAYAQQVSAIAAFYGFPKKG
jgi:hypothetical protein